jgi:hypothetical protein
MPVAKQWLSSRHVIAATNSCSEQYFLFGPRRVYVMRTSCHYKKVEKEFAGRQLRNKMLVAEARGGERPPLEAATKQRSEDCD